LYFWAARVTPTQRFLSCLLVAHMAALFIHAIPGLDDFATDPIMPGESGWVTPVAAAFDDAAERIVWLHRVSSSVTQPLRRLTSPYIRVTSQYQTWNMFANPARLHQELRIGYRFQAADYTSRTEFEHIFPAGPPEVKLFTAYFDSFTDKLLAAEIENYRRLGRAAAASGEPISPEAVARTLRPVTRFYGARRIAAGVPAGTRLTAVEFWFGTTPMSLPASLLPQTGTAPPEPDVSWQLWMTDDWQ
jgi:hypothetical protein